MEVSTQPKMAFLGVDILHVNFNAISPRKGEEMTIDVNCDPKVFYPINDKLSFKILMKVEIKDENFFELHLEAVGHFALQNELDEHLKKVFINHNAPAIMFPYIRSFVSTLTVNMGDYIGPITIPSQFFRGDLEEILE